MPVYNGQIQYLKEAVRSTFLEQEYDKEKIEIQLLMVDDGSDKEEIVQYIDEMGEREDCHVLRHDSNKGLHEALNKGMKWARE